MTFAEPIWLAAGALFTLAGALLLRALSRRRRLALARFAGHTLLDRLTTSLSSTRRRVKEILLLAALFLLFVSLARPQWGFQWLEVKQRGIDLLFALDTSRSMLAQDIRPNRLERARLAILDFVNRLAGDRVGLLPFAGSAFLLCPLTLDYDAFADSLRAVDTGLLPFGGTSLATVIEQAATTLEGSNNHKILIILSDGEDLSGDALTAARKAADRGLTIHTVGVGSRGGELLPLPEGGFVRDRAGNFVSSRLDEAMLAEIAAASGGLYLPLGQSGEGLESLYQEKLALVPKEEFAERRQKLPVERFAWPLLLAIALLVLEALIGERRRTPLSPDRLWLLRLFRRPSRYHSASALLLFALFSATPPALADGFRAYQEGDFATAAEMFRTRLEKDPTDPIFQYNFATAAHRQGNYDEAIAAFGQALQSEETSLQKKAYFNRGNSYFRKGVNELDTDPEKTLSLWQQALDSFQAALALQPQDEDARHNRDHVRQLLTELQQQLEQQAEEKQQAKKDARQSEEQDGRQPGQQDTLKPGEQDTQKSEEPEEPGTRQPEPQDSRQPGEQDAGQPEEQPGNGGSGSAEPSEEREEHPPVAANTPTTPLGEGRREGAEAVGQSGRPPAMTRDEAEQLLKALKNEEGELNWIPAGRGSAQEPDKDW